MRLFHLHSVMQVNPSPKKVKLDAWRIKASCVLLKKKAKRGQWPKNPLFRNLMTDLTGEEPPARRPGAQEVSEENEEAQGGEVVNEDDGQEADGADEVRFPFDTRGGRNLVDQIPCWYRGIALILWIYSYFPTFSSPLHFTHTVSLLPFSVRMMLWMGVPKGKQMLQRKGMNSRLWKKQFLLSSNAGSPGRSER